MKLIDYREKLGIGFSDDDKFNMLKNRIQNFVENMNYRNYGSGSFLRYFSAVCERYDNYSQMNFALSNSFETTSNIPELIYKYIVFYNTYLPDDPYYSDKFKNEVLIFLEGGLTHLRIQYELMEDNDGKYIFPKGVSDFDEALVSQPLDWLKDYSKAEIAWGKALRAYAETADDNASDIADKFRKALETFFQEFFGNTKTLENNKSIYGDYLKQRNVPKEISGNLETVLQAYTNYMNNYAKHRDRTSDTLLEYIMYQTGNIIRLLIVLKQEELSDAD